MPAWTGPAWTGPAWTGTGISTPSDSSPNVLKHLDGIRLEHGPINVIESPSLRGHACQRVANAPQAGVTAIGALSRTSVLSAYCPEETLVNLDTSNGASYIPVVQGHTKTTHPIVSHLVALLALRSAFHGIGQAEDAESGAGSAGGDCSQSRKEQ